MASDESSVMMMMENEDVTFVRVWSIPCDRLLPLCSCCKYRVQQARSYSQGWGGVTHYGLHDEEATYWSVDGLTLSNISSDWFADWRCFLSQLLLQAMLILTLPTMVIVLGCWIWINRWRREKRLKNVNAGEWKSAPRGNSVSSCTLVFSSRFV